MTSLAIAQVSLVRLLRDRTGLFFIFALPLMIILVLGTLVWALMAVWHAAPSLRWVVYANIPYLLWVSFATVLQLTVTYLNL